MPTGADLPYDPDDLEPDPSDEPFVAQIKLLRKDLRNDKTERAAFEKRVNFRSAVATIAALVAVAAVIIGGAVIANAVADLKDSDKQTAEELAAACQERQEGREGVKSAILEGDINALQQLINVAGSQNDPRAIELLASARETGMKRLDEVLPPITCD